MYLIHVIWFSFVCFVFCNMQVFWLIFVKQLKHYRNLDKNGNVAKNEQLKTY